MIRKIKTVIVVLLVCLFLLYLLSFLLNETNFLDKTELDVSSANANKVATVGSIAVANLNVEARNTYRLIYKGGPFPYSQDGSVFYNYGKKLPVNTKGYYREYTVAKQTAKSRGAKRIVCGGLEPRLPDICYYTEDHYASFKKITS